MLEGEKEMKKVIGIVFIVFTLLTLSSCKEKEKTRFDELYDENFDTALEVSKISQSDRNGKYHSLKEYKKYSYQEYKIRSFLNIPWQMGEKEKVGEILDDYEFRNIIIAEFSYNNEGYQPEVIECLNEEDAKNLSEDLSKGMYEFYYRENIVYNSTRFSVVFMEGMISNIINGFVYSKDTEILIGKNRDLICEKLELPETIETVGEYALYFIKNTRNIVCNENLKKITKNGMAGMKSLKEVVLNEGLTTLGPLCFNYCLNLKKINIPSTLEKIYPYAFYDCNNLKYVVIPEGVEYIGEKAFNKTTLYCEVESKPEDWAEDFICEGAKVYWAGEWEYDEDGIPTPLKH